MVKVPRVDCNRMDLLVFDITNIEVEAGVTGRAAYNGGDVVNYGFVDVVAVYEDGKSLDALVVDGLQILDA